MREELLVSPGCPAWKETEERLKEIFSELEIILLENNVALEVVEKIKENLKKSLIDLEVKRADIDKKIIEALIRAHEIRPERYTILGETGLTKDAAKKLAKITGVI